MKTCLIVDDSRVVRKMAARILTSIGGFQIDEAENGAQALARCEKQLPDLIMLDWYMPVLSGLEFLAKARALPGGDKAVIIFCTTQNEVAHIRQAMEAGADEYVMKPFDQDILAAKLEQVGML